MRASTPRLSAMLVLVLLSSAASLWAATVRFNPQPQGGSIYTVINFAEARGQNQPTSVTVDWGAVHRTVRVSPYGKSCSRVFPSGFVLKLRNSGAPTTSVPLKLSTNGKIVRGPYQGEIPLELLNACYRLK